MERLNIPSGWPGSIAYVPSISPSRNTSSSKVSFGAIWTRVCSGEAQSTSSEIRMAESGGRGALEACALKSLLCLRLEFVLTRHSSGDVSPGSN